MTPHRRRLALAALLTVPLVVAAAPAAAEPGSASRGSMTLTVSQATGLSPDGQRVRVRGSGYDRSKGIYVAFCVIPPAGQTPTPCGGGADTEGSSGNSVWISDFPPYYGTGLARPFGAGGSFDVEISVRAQLDEEVDCRAVRCAVVTRADHTRSEDRSSDVFVPISFTAPATAAPTTVAGGTAPASPPPAAAAATRQSAAPSAAAAVVPLPAEVAPPAPAASASPSPSASASPLDEPSAVAAEGGDVPAAGPTTLAVSPQAADDGGGLSTPLAAAGLLALAGAGLAAGRTLLARRAARVAG